MTINPRNARAWTIDEFFKRSNNKHENKKGELNNIHESEVFVRSGFRLLHSDVILTKC